MNISFERQEEDAHDTNIAREKQGEEFGDVGDVYEQQQEDPRCTSNGSSILYGFE